MNSKFLWQSAQEPNYSTHTNKFFPYSEVPHLNEYQPIKIPLSLNDLISHVDYWGEGKVVIPEGSSGFTNCYNVNLPYQLVSTGPDRGRKIPNRIPVSSHDNCDTSKYIRDNSVVTVTLMQGTINDSCVTDIARIVNKDLGKVILYDPSNIGYPPYIDKLTDALKKKYFFQCPSYTLPDNLESNKHKEHVAFLNINMIKDELLNFITKGAYNEAVSLSKSMCNENSGEAIEDVVYKILSSNSLDNLKLISFGYQLWYHGGVNIVWKHFPAAFYRIYGNHFMDMKLVNGPSKPDGSDNSKPALGLKWHFDSIWNENRVVFVLYKYAFNTTTKLGDHQITFGDDDIRNFGYSKRDSHTYIIKPLMKSGFVEFSVIKSKHLQEMNLDASGDDEKVGNIYEDVDGFKFIISES